MCILALAACLSSSSITGAGAFNVLHSPASTTRRNIPATNTLSTLSRVVADNGGSSSRSTGIALNMASNVDSSSRASTRKAKKNITDRTPEETRELLSAILKAIIDAGPQAGPRRTFEAYRAVTRTIQDFLPIPSSSSTKGSTAEDFSVPKLLRKIFERMGATYVKLGQFIASSPTIFPKEYVLEFQKCLDSTEPVEWSIIKNVIEQELDGPISNYYSYVNPTPLASASIAQVHVATLKSTGEEVVIKVQKPGVAECLKADLGFILVTAKIIEYIQPDWERTSLGNIISDIKTSMLDELDFVKEARNTIEFRKFLQDNDLLQAATAPRVFSDYSTKRILTLERLNGVSMLDEDTIANVLGPDTEVDGSELIIRALNIWSMSLTSMPFFHADVHAGNLLLLDDGRIGFIDFGIVGRISDKVFGAINELSVALSVNDFEQVAQALCNMGAADEDVDTEKFGKELQKVLEKMNNIQPDLMVDATNPASVTASIGVNENEISTLLLDLVDVTENNGLKLPREFGLIVKQSLYFDRYMKILAPNVDVMADDRLNIGGISREEQEQKEQVSSGRNVNGSPASEVVIDV